MLKITTLVKCFFLKIKYFITGVLYNFDIVTLLWHSLKSGPEARYPRILGHGTLTPGTLALGPWDLGRAILSPRTLRIKLVTQIPSILRLDQQLTRTADCVKQILIKTYIWYIGFYTHNTYIIHTYIFTFFYEMNFYM